MTADDIAEEALEIVAMLEWSGVQHGPPTGMGLNNGERLAACPFCRGLKDDGGFGFPKSSIGHVDDCKMGRVMAAVRRAFNA